LSGPVYISLAVGMSKGLSYDHNVLSGVLTGTDWASFKEVPSFVSQL